MGGITVLFETFVIAYISTYTLTVCTYVVILSISTVYVCNNDVVIPFGLFSLCTLISFSLFNVYTCTCMWISGNIPCFNRKQIVVINVYWPLFPSSSLLSLLSSLSFPPPPPSLLLFFSSTLVYCQYCILDWSDYTLHVPPLSRAVEALL